MIAKLRVIFANLRLKLYHQELLRHLLADHSFVIGDVNLVANFPAYAAYWRDKFRTQEVASFCSSMRAPVTTETGATEADM